MIYYSADLPVLQTQDLLDHRTKTPSSFLLILAHMRFRGWDYINSKDLGNDKHARGATYLPIRHINDFQKLSGEI